MSDETKLPEGGFCPKSSGKFLHGRGENADCLYCRGYRDSSDRLRALEVVEAAARNHARQEYDPKRWNPPSLVLLVDSLAVLQPAPPPPGYGGSGS